MNDEKSPPRRGRPPKFLGSEERIARSLRMRPEIEAAIRDAAEANHRSIAEELEYRIEKSFEIEVLMEKIVEDKVAEKTKSLDALKNVVEAQREVETTKTKRLEIGGKESLINYRKSAIERKLTMIKRYLDRNRPLPSYAMEDGLSNNAAELQSEHDRLRAEEQFIIAEVEESTNNYRAAIYRLSAAQGEYARISGIYIRAQ